MRLLRRVCLRLPYSPDFAMSDTPPCAVPASRPPNYHSLASSFLRQTTHTPASAFPLLRNMTGAQPLHLANKSVTPRIITPPPPSTPAPPPPPPPPPPGEPPTEVPRLFVGGPYTLHMECTHDVRDSTQNSDPHWVPGDPNSLPTKTKALWRDNEDTSKAVLSALKGWKIVCKVQRGGGRNTPMDHTEQVDERESRPGVQFVQNGWTELLDNCHYEGSMPAIWEVPMGKYDAPGFVSYIPLHPTQSVLFMALDQPHEAMS